MFSTLPKQNFNFWGTFTFSSSNTFNLNWSRILMFQSNHSNYYLRSISCWQVTIDWLIDFNYVNAILSHSHTMTPFDAPWKQAFWKHCGTRRNCSSRAISLCPTVFSTRLDNFLPFSSNLKLSSANSFNSEESKIWYWVTRRQILDWSKLKQSADDNFIFDRNIRKFYKRVENTVGKGEIAQYKQFLLFPQCFQKACFPGASKSVIVWE